MLMNFFNIEFLNLFFDVLIFMSMDIYFCTVIKCLVINSLYDFFKVLKIILFSLFLWIFFFFFNEFKRICRSLELRNFFIFLLFMGVNDMFLFLDLIMFKYFLILSIVDSILFLIVGKFFFKSLNLFSSIFFVFFFFLFFCCCIRVVFVCSLGNWNLSVFFS